jgi:hypothetical protein
MKVRKNNMIRLELLEITLDDRHHEHLDFEGLKIYFLDSHEGQNLHLVELILKICLGILAHDDSNILII